MPTQPLLSQELATKALVLYGLQHLREVGELFHPLAVLLSQPLPPEREHSTSSSLFKKGDGVNVYSEAGSFSLLLYQSCLVSQGSLPVSQAVSNLLSGTGRLSGEGARSWAATRHLLPLYLCLHLLINQGEEGSNIRQIVANIEKTTYCNLYISV